MKKEFDIYTKLINNVSVVVESLRCQDYCKAMVQLKTITNMLMQSSDDILQNLNYYNQYGQIITLELYVELIENITKAQENEDYLYLADLLDNQLSIDIKFFFHYLSSSFMIITQILLIIS